MAGRIALILTGLGAAALLGATWLVLDRTPAGAPTASAGEASPAAEARGEARLVDPDADAGTTGRDAALPAAEGTSLRGRVVDERDGSGLAGAWLALWSAPDGERLAEAQSARDGGFAFALVPPAGARVRAEAPYGWVLFERELPSSGPLTFRARPVRRAPLRLELVDGATGERVPDARLMVRPASGGGVQELESDERGACASELAFEEGELRVALVQETLAPAEPRAWRPPIAPIAHAGDPQAAPRELALPVGPTLRLDLRLPEGIELGMLHALLLPPGVSGLEREDGAARVRVREDPDGGWPWVRFAWDIAVLQPLREGPCTLVVRDNARRWRGSAPVPARGGVHRDVVAIALSATAELEVEVLGGDGAPVQGAQIVLADGAGRHTAAARTGIPGAARFAGLPPGEYRLSVTQREHVDHERGLRAAPGGLERVRVVLERATVGGSVSGRVRAGTSLSRSAARRTLVVRLEALGDGARSFELPLAFADGDDGARVADFRFDDVPAGAWALTLVPSLPHRVWPQRIEVSPPAAGLLFAELPPGALLPLDVLAVDGEDGGALEDAWLWAHAEGSSPLERPAEGSGGPWLPPAADVAWGIGAPGHVPRFGARADLSVAEVALAARVPLARGFGLRLVASDAAGAPIADVEVRADGDAVGVTDADGRLLLAAATAPQSIALEHARWRPPDDLAQLFAQAVAAGRPQLALVLAPR